MPRKTTLTRSSTCRTACRKANLMSLSPTFWPTCCVCSAKCLPRVPNKAAALSCPAFGQNKSEELSGIYSQWFDIEPAEIEEGWARD